MDAPSISNAVGLQSLLDEPIRLAAEAERLNIELESLVMDNYKVFVENLTCSVHLKIEDKKLGEISQDLDANLLDLSQQCLTFKDRVNHFVGSHKRNRKTLQHHMQLVELLEVPQLVDACARNGFHDEALELAHFVNGLERRHLLASEVKSQNGKLRGGSGVIQSIVDDVHRTLSGLRQQLLLQLTENTTLPKEISVLATLRKLDGLLIDRHLSLERHDYDRASSSSVSDMNAMHQQQRDKQRQILSQNSEVRLQMDFLEARTIWLHNYAERTLHIHRPESNRDLSSEDLPLQSTDAQQQKGSAAALGPYGRISEMLEIRRTAWFAVITQFNALFQDHLRDNAPGRGDGKSSRAVDDGFVLSEYSAAAILHAWATRQVNQLLSELQNLLPSIEEGASLRSLLEQTLFFASRMSQVGCDFSGLVIPIFEEIMLSRFHKELCKAVEHFKVMLLTERVWFDSEGDSMSRDQLIPLYAAQDHPNITTTTTQNSSTSSNASTIAPSTTDLPPPQLLMYFPPIAYLLNCILTHLNYLRECPLVTCEQPALDMVFSVLQDICAYLVVKSADIRTLGEKYLNTTSRGDKKKSGKEASGELKSDSMEKRYAQALVQELLPHVLLCFDTIYNGNTARLEVKLRSARAKDMRRTSENNTDSINKLICLVTNLYDARDLFDSELLERVAQVWGVLVEGGLLSADVLTRTTHSTPLPLPARPPVPSEAPAGGAAVSTEQQQLPVLNATIAETEETVTETNLAPSSSETPDLASTIPGAPESAPTSPEAPESASNSSAVEAIFDRDLKKD